MCDGVLEQAAREWRGQRVTVFGNRMLARGEERF